MGNVLEMDNTRFSAHELHLYALYNEIRISGRVRTMLQSDIIKRMNARQDEGDRSTHGAVSGQDIEFVMKNFAELRDCHRSVILMPELPPPVLELPETKPKKKRKRKPGTPVSTAMAKLKRKGYTCRVRHRGPVPVGNHFLFLNSEYKEYKEKNITTATFSGDIAELRSMLGDEFKVENLAEEGKIRIQRGVEPSVSRAADEQSTQEENLPVEADTGGSVENDMDVDDLQFYLEP